MTDKFQKNDEAIYTLIGRPSRVRILGRSHEFRPEIYRAESEEYDVEFLDDATMQKGHITYGIAAHRLVLP